jgi:uncharacterized protein (TIGR02246 family)
MPKRNLITLSLTLAVAVTVTPRLHGDEAAVRKAIEAYAQAFNDQDAETLASYWAEQGTHVDRHTGERTERRDAIMADLAAVLQERPDTRLTGRVDHVRLITPDVAHVEGQTGVGAPGQAPSLSAFSGILVNQDGRWVIVSMEESPLPQPATATDALRPLEWLVGQWTDQSGTVRVDTTVSWSTNEAFLLRSYVIQDGDGLVREGTQVIGWDPRARRIRSWSFNSDGSFGDGIWSNNGEDWLVKSSQTLADGQAASGTYVITRVDDDRMTVQLIGHEVEGEPRPSSEPVTVVRKPLGSQ